MSKQTGREAFKQQMIDAFQLCAKEVSDHPKEDRDVIVYRWAESCWALAEAMADGSYEAGTKGEPNPLEKEVELERPNYDEN